MVVEICAKEKGNDNDGDGGDDDLIQALLPIKKRHDVVHW